jgi:hypothetical protein
MSLQRWFWYVARENELMIDCDSKALLEIAMKRLQDTTRIGIEEPLSVKDIFLAPSKNSEHFHITVRLNESIDPIRRAIWQLFLFDDVTRSTHNLFRAVNNIPAPSLLISPYNWLNLSTLATVKFWRSHDAVCTCSPLRHKSAKAILECPAHILLRGTKCES